MSPTTFCLASARCVLVEVVVVLLCIPNPELLLCDGRRRRQHSSGDSNDIGRRTSSRCPCSTSYVAGRLKFLFSLALAATLFSYPVVCLVISV